MKQNCPQRVHARANFRGFSLLEVLIALALLTAMMGTMFAFFWEMLSTRERILDFTAENRGAGMLIDRLQRDLQTCVVGDAALGAGVQGDETNLRLLTRSVPVRLVEETEAPGPFCDIETAIYRFTAGSGRIELGRTLAAPGASSAGGNLSPIAEGVFKVRFRYHDGTMWRSEFDSLEADRLPQAIEVAVWYDPWPSALLDMERDAAEAEVSPDDDALDEEPWFDGGFDERAFAEASDDEFNDDPPPDRIRVIIIPDAVDEEDSSPDGGEEAR
jgi:prepilin-type N-terminal cleavage/methylation domain-containing protein